MIHSKEKNIATAEFLAKAGQKADLLNALKLLKVEITWKLIIMEYHQVSPVH